MGRDAGGPGVDERRVAQPACDPGLAGGGGAAILNALQELGARDAGREAEGRHARQKVDDRGEVRPAAPQLRADAVEDVITTTPTRMLQANPTRQ